MSRITRYKGPHDDNACNQLTLGVEYVGEPFDLVHFVSQKHFQRRHHRLHDVLIREAAVEVESRDVVHDHSSSRRIATRKGKDVTGIHLWKALIGSRYSWGNWDILPA